MESGAPRDTTLHALEYGSKDPLHRRRVLHQVAIYFALSSAALSLIQPIESLWHSARLYYCEQKCLAHPIAPGSLVCSSGPPVITSVSNDFNRLRQGWEWGNAIFWPGNLNSVIYLGSRRASNGLTRFIALAGIATTPPLTKAEVSFLGLNLPMAFDGHQFTGQWFTLPGDSVGASASSFRWPHEILIYSAVEDPHDASRFTFSFDCDWIHATVDCRLQPDGSLNVTNQYSEYQGYLSGGIRSGTPSPLQGGGGIMVVKTPVPK